MEVELTAVEGRALTFVHARDDAAVIARGTHRRSVNTPRRFTARLQDRAAHTTPAS